MLRFQDGAVGFKVKQSKYKGVYYLEIDISFGKEMAIRVYRVYWLERS